MLEFKGFNVGIMKLTGRKGKARPSEDVDVAKELNVPIIDHKCYQYR